MIKKGQLPELSNDVISAFLKSLDKFDLFEHDDFLSTIPFGKSVAYLIKKKFEINDEEKALQTAVGTAFYISLLDAINFFNLNKNLPDKASEELLFKVETSLLYTFNKDEFDRSNFINNKISQRYKDIFKKTLNQFKFSEENIIKIIKYIDDYVVLNFVLVLSKNPTTYSKAINYLNSDVYTETLLSYNINRYKTNLKNLLNEPVWKDKEGLTLEKIYIKPNYKIHKYCFKESDMRVSFENREDDKGFVQIDYSDGSIHEFMNNVLLRKNKLNLKIQTPQLILLLGFPGQGKTSFCKKMLFDTFSGKLPIDKEIYFVKFKTVSRLKELLNNPLNTLRNKICEEIGVEIHMNKIHSSILLLDGLDELYMKENMQKNEIDQFIKSFFLEIKTYEDLIVIITTRYGYLDLSNLKERDVLICQLGELDFNQQKEWLSTYKSYHPECVLTHDKISEIHKEKNLAHISELIRQPILLHMIASLSMEIDSNDNKAKIYDKLFKTLVSREYDSSNKGQIENLKGPKEEDIRKLIREIAFEIFKTGDEYIHKNELKELKAVKRFIESLENKNFNEALKGLMIAFYFQEVRKKEGDEGIAQEKNEDYAIEFLHKSLQEFLVAEKIWAKMIFFTETRSDGDYFIDDFEDAIKETFELFAYQKLSREIVGYLVEIILNDELTDKKEVLKRLNYFFPDYLENSFLKKYEAKKNSEHSAFDFANNHFYGYWSVMSHIDSENVVPLDPYFEHLFVQQIKSLLLDSTYMNLSFQKFQSLDLSGINLDESDMIKSDFSHSHLTGSYLIGSNFSNSILKGVDFSGAHLFGCNFINTDLISANFSGSILTESDFTGADLIDAIFLGVNLSHVIFDKSTLSNMNFRGTDLSNSLFISANINKTDFHGANLSETDFSDTNLQNSFFLGAQITSAVFNGAFLEGNIFSGANLYASGFRNANLSFCNFKGGDLTKSIFIETNIEESNFAGSILSESDFSNAKLNKVDFSGGNLEYLVLYETKLIDCFFNGADFFEANFSEAYLYNCNFANAKHLTADQLIQTKSLKGCENLDASLEQEIIRLGYGYLFE